MATTDFIAAIELSSSKISGIAGKKSSDGSIQVLAYAREDASPFIHKGAIYNIDKAAQALTSIINKLEGQLNNSIAKVYVGIGGQSLRTVRNAVSRTLEEESIISQELVDEICDENRDVPLVDMSVLDVAPQEYKIDNTLHARRSCRKIHHRAVPQHRSACLAEEEPRTQFRASQSGNCRRPARGSHCVGQSRADRKRDAFRLCTGGLRCRHHHRAGL